MKDFKTHVYETVTIAPKAFTTSTNRSQISQQYGFWIAPDGKAYPVTEVYEHAKFAFNILGIDPEEYEKTNDYYDIYDKMYDKGYIRVITQKTRLSIEMPTKTTRAAMNRLDTLINIYLDEAFQGNSSEVFIEYFAQTILSTSAIEPQDFIRKWNATKRRFL